MLSASHLFAKCFPKASAPYKDAFTRFADKLLAEAGINTALRRAHFLAQCGHECMGFTVIRENMNYSESRLLAVFGAGQHSAAITKAEASRLAKNGPALAERVYGLGNPTKARDLGNTQSGDGWRFRGNGPLQNTGRKAHRLASAGGVDFEANPELMAKAEHILKPAIAFWTANRLNALADRNDIGGLTKKVNGGRNGLAERKALFDRIFKLASAGEVAWKVASADKGVEFLQRDLKTLGLYAGAIDGKFGPKTEAAVRAFQKLAGITVDGDAGRVTLAAIKNRLDRVNTRVDDRPVVEDKTVQRAGIITTAATATVSVATEVASDGLADTGRQIVDAARQGQDLAGSSHTLQIVLAIALVVGVVFIALPRIRGVVAKVKEAFA